MAKGVGKRSGRVGSGKNRPAPASRRASVPPIAFRSIAASVQAPAYNHVAMANGFAFVAGHLAADEAGVPPRLGDIEVETRTAMDLLKAVLADIGLGFQDVVRTNVYLTDLGEFERMNKVYGSYFQPGRLPARTTVGVANLLFGCRVEIDCVARLRSLPPEPGRPKPRRKETKR